MWVTLYVRVLPSTECTRSAKFHNATRTRVRPLSQGGFRIGQRGIRFSKDIETPKALSPPQKFFNFFFCKCYIFAAILQALDKFLIFNRKEKHCMSNIYHMLCYLFILSVSYRFLSVTFLTKERCYIQELTCWPSP